MELHLELQVKFRLDIRKCLLTKRVRWTPDSLLCLLVEHSVEGVKHILSHLPISDFQHKERIQKQMKRQKYAGRQHIPISSYKQVVLLFLWWDIWVNILWDYCKHSSLLIAAQRSYLKNKHSAQGEIRLYNSYCKRCLKHVAKAPLSLRCKENFHFYFWSGNTPLWFHCGHWGSHLVFTPSSIVSQPAVHYDTQHRDSYCTKAAKNPPKQSL